MQSGGFRHGRHASLSHSTPVSSLSASPSPSLSPSPSPHPLPLSPLPASLLGRLRDACSLSPSFQRLRACLQMGSLTAPKSQK